MRDPGTIAYTFRAQLQTVDLSSIPNFKIERLLLITNLTARQDIYAGGDEKIGYASVNNGVVTLAYDTRPMSDDDKLQIFYEDGTAVLPANAATADRQDAALAVARGSMVTADVAGTLAAGVVQTVIAANLNRQFCEITNTGADPLAYRWGSDASAVAGHILGPGQTARYDTRVPTASLSLFSTAGTTFFATTG